MHGVQEENRKEVRLQKAIAESGLCSRRNAEELIKKGLVRVNGEIAIIGMNVDVEKDKILVNGQYLRPENKIYLMLNKPRNYITTVMDPYGRKSVTALINEPQRVFPVGRLDKDTTGMLLLTNDGEFANRVMHPRYEVEKVYEVTLDRKIDEAEITRLNQGVYLDRQFIELRVSKTGPKTARVTVHTGLNKEIKRIFKQEGHWVLALRRTSIQGVQMNKLKEGNYRHLTKTEVQMFLTPRARPKRQVIPKSSGTTFVPNPKPYVPREERRAVRGEDSRRRPTSSRFPSRSDRRSSDDRPGEKPPRVFGSASKKSASRGRSPRGPRSNPGRGR